MAGRGFDAFVAERFLRLADILAGKLGADKAAKIVWFDVIKANFVRILAYAAPNRNSG